MSKEVVQAILEGEVITDQNPLQVEVQNQITQMYNEGAFTRTVATIASAIGAGWGAAKMSSAWLAQNGVPGPIADIFSGITRSTAGAMKWFGTFRYAEMNGSSGLAVMGDAVFSGNATLGMLAAGSQFYLPTALVAISGIIGGTLMVVALRKLFQQDPSIKSQYRELEKSVNERDKQLERFNKTVKKYEKAVDGADTEKASALEKDVKRGAKDIDKMSKDIMKEANKLEKQVMKHADRLDENEMETITSFIEVAKNGMLSNKQRG